jgi:hypothetical protein
MCESAPLIPSATRFVSYGACDNPYGNKLYPSVEAFDAPKETSVEEPSYPEDGFVHSNHKLPFTEAYYDHGLRKILKVCIAKLPASVTANIRTSDAEGRIGSALDNAMYEDGKPVRASDSSKKLCKPMCGKYGELSFMNKMWLGEFEYVKSLLEAHEASGKKN